MNLVALELGVPCSFETVSWPLNLVFRFPKWSIAIFFHLIFFPPGGKNSAFPGNPHHTHTSPDAHTDTHTQAPMTENLKQ